LSTENKACYCTIALPVSLSKMSEFAALWGKFRPTEASPDSEVTVEEKLPIFFLIFNYSILVCH